MWKRNLLFALLCLTGLGALAAGLMRRDRLSNPASFDPGRMVRGDLATVIDQVDREFRRHWDEKKLAAAPRASDLTIARRLSLGLTGTIPSLEEIRELESRPADQRLEWWTSRLLEDRRFADYVAERLARAYVGTDDGPFLVYRRRRFVTWLSDELLANRPYDQLVGQLISSSGIWTSTPAVNFVSATIQQNATDQPDPVKLAGRTTRAFLGMRIDCLQCHDDKLGKLELGPTDDLRYGTQADFHALAAFYSDASVSLGGIGDRQRPYRYKFLDSDQEETVAPATPFLPELHRPHGSLREQLARWVTHPDNKPFARATVNRFWALLFGRPLVEPIDEIPLQGPFPPALEALAEDFVGHGYDLHRLIRAIAASEVFGLDSRAEFEVTAGHEEQWAVFPLTRLRPEQVAGALIQSASLKTIDAHSHIVFRLARFGDEREFVRRYGDTGQDEFTDRGGTITQRLLMMNGDLLKEKTRENPLVNAATKIALLAAREDLATEVAYLAVLTRRPSPTESRAFAQRLADQPGNRRTQALEDLYWTLLNSSEFSWNH